MHSRHPRLPGERFFLGLLVLLSAFMVWAAWETAGFESLTSAGVFPMACAGLMVLTGLINLLRALRTPPAPGLGTDGPPADQRPRVLPRALIGLGACLTAYLLALEPLGFLVASLLFLVVAMRVLGSRRLLRNVLVSVLVVALVFLIFRTVFSVVLPAGTLVAPWLPDFLR